MYRMGACKGCKERREALQRLGARVKTALSRKNANQQKGLKK